jgi:hypothetical protein
VEARILSKVDIAFPSIMVIFLNKIKIRCYLKFNFANFVTLSVFMVFKTL